jgi:hypothetical protein
MRPVIALLVLLLLAALPVAAQDTPPVGCAPDDWLNMLDTASAAIDRPGADVNLALDILIVSLQVQRAICNGFAFSGNGGEVVGPFDLPAGDYVLTATYSEHGILNLDTLTDECSLFIIRQSSILFTEPGSIQSVLRTDQECRLLATANTRAPWTLTITPVG